jgi:hypothetical protein
MAQGYNPNEGRLGTQSAALRGGSWINESNNAAAAYRNRNQANNWNNNIGFRVVLSIALLRFSPVIGWSIVACNAFLQIRQCRFKASDKRSCSQRLFMRSGK